MARPIQAADLPEDIARIAEAQVAAGRFANIDEVVRAGVLALQREQEKHDALRAALEEGENSGIFDGNPFDSVRAELRVNRHQP